jgi:5-methylcytosine-specific restriction endonuclease McrBC regulatory subunit McrC
MPDLWLEWPGTTLVIDAKYKAHWDRFDLEHVREEHRHDLHQVLAYAALASTPRVIACLAYPCPVDEWSGLRARGRHLRQAEIFVANRRLNLWLMAMPMSAEAEDVAGPLATLIRDHLAAA